MQQNDSELKENQILAIEALMSSKTYTAAAALAGCSRVTLYRWMKTDLFKAELSKQKNELIERSSRKLAGAMDQAIEVLIQLLKSKNQNVRRLAAGNLIDYCLKFSAFTDIEFRIKALEAAIDKK